MSLLPPPISKPELGIAEQLVFALAVISLLFAAAIFCTGGFSYTIFTVPISSHNPRRPLWISVAGLALLLFFSRAWRARLQSALGNPEGTASRVAFVTICATLAAGLCFGTYAACGADAYGYVSQAELWTRGTLHVSQPIALSVPWPDADWTFTPLGYKPAIFPGAIVPIYPPGLPLAMALLQLVAGRWAVYLIGPVLGAAAVWFTFDVGRRIDGSVTGVVSAMLLASSPIFLFQLIQPMSDVAVTGWWMMAVALVARCTPAGAFVGGLAGGAAVMTRPNLLPIALILGGFLALASPFDRSRWKLVAFFALGLLPGCVALASIHDALYGSPMNIGYDRPTNIYGVAYVLPNLKNYSRWLLDLQTPFVWLSLATPVLVWSKRLAKSRGRQDLDAARLVWLCTATAVVVIVSYLIYMPYDHWTFLRFLLPALPLILILSVTVLMTALRHVTLRWGARIGVISCALLIWVYATKASSIGVFTHHEETRLCVIACDYLASALPKHAVVLAMQQSGGVRYYTGRLTLRYDLLHTEWLDGALAYLRSQGYVPYIVLEEWEEPRFRSRFANGSAIGRVDWPPRWMIEGGLRIYDPADRPRFVAGERVQTQRITRP